MKLSQEPSGCRWIIGDPRELDWRYCQAAIVKTANPHSIPYCPTHLSLAYRKRLPPEARDETLIRSPR